MTTRKENIVIPKEAYVIWGKLSAFENILSGEQMRVK